MALRAGVWTSRRHRWGGPPSLPKQEAAGREGVLLRLAMHGQPRQRGGVLTCVGCALATCNCLVRLKCAQVRPSEKGAIVQLAIAADAPRALCPAQGKLAVGTGHHLNFTLSVLGPGVHYILDSTAGVRWCMGVCQR